MIPARPPVVPGVTRGAGDRFGIPNPRKSGSVIGADRQRFHPSCVLLKRVPQGRTESGGIVLAANAGPRAPSGGVTLKRRCTYQASVIYLIVNKLLSVSLSRSCSLVLSLSLSFSLSLSLCLSFSRSLGRWVRAYTATLQGRPPRRPHASHIRNHELHVCWHTMGHRMQLNPTPQLE